ncbi:MAG: response regulator transcription factor [Chloroflexota bacterium]
MKKTKEVIKVLLAEDHVVVRESIRQALENEANLEVIGEANNGLEAVEMTKRLNPDVILMDISMPELNGIEATREIKAFKPGIKILILTAYDYEQYIFSLLEAGAAGYLLKDVSSHELITAINTVYKGDVVLHPAIARKVMQRFQHTEDQQAVKNISGLLTEREIDELKMAAKGMSNSAIAEELHFSVRTIESHLGTIFNKMGVGSRTEAAIQAVKRGWLTLEDLP